MSLYTRARKYIDMNRVKELREEKIKRQKIAEVKKQQEEILAELKRIEIKEDLKYSNWRRDLENLNEDMTTASLGMINYPAVGDVNLAQFDYPVQSLGSSPGYSQSGNDYTFGPASAGIPPAENSSLTFEMNSEIYDTIVFDFVNSGVIDELKVVTGSDGGLSTYNISTSSGRKVVTLVPADRKKLVTVAWSITRSAGGGLGTNKILNVSFQRRAPMNLFVGLDDPEANSFIRGGLGGDKDRRQKLKDMLEAGNQWMYIQGLEPSKTSPGDIALDTIPYEPPSPGPGGYKPPGSYDPNKFYDLKTDPSQLPSPNLPSTGPGRSSVPDGTKVAAEYPRQDPLDKLLKDIDDADKKLRKQGPGTRPGKGRGMGDTWEGPGKIV